VEAANPHGLIPTLIRRLKDAYPDLTVITDVALDPYNSDGHDGIVSDCGSIANDLTVRVLCQQALEQARAGADIIAPSDMMDGRVAAIRATLDAHGFAESVSVLSYTAKYASAFYGPFRDALDSAPASGSDSGRIIPATKQTYQMDPANWREAMREVDLDVAEGADMLMVKPAGPYLDIIQRVSCATDLPVAAYQVSGEYAMIKAASMNGWLDEDQAVMESLTAIRRAGADVVFTYYARHAARLLA
jgi:porphobilinogen synthase